MADLDKEPFLALCRADDAQGMLALLGRLGLSHSDEAVFGQRAIEFAIEADAPKTFEALLDLAAEQGDPHGLRQRLWGGVTPLHQ